MGGGGGGGGGGGKRFGPGVAWINAWFTMYVHDKAHARGIFPCNLSETLSSHHAPAGAPDAMRPALVNYVNLHVDCAS